MFFILQQNSIQPSLLSYTQGYNGRISSTTRQQNVLLREAHQCSVVLPIILVKFIDASRHWTKRNSDREMLTVQKHDIIIFEIQTAGMHRPAYAS